MPVELRKRKAPQPPPAPAPAVKRASKAGRPSKAKAAASKKEEAATKKDAPAAPAAAAGAAVSPPAVAANKVVAVGDVIDLDGFGGEIETNDGKKTSLKELVEESESGVVLFTYPKASTPGCTFFISYVLLALRELISLRR